MLQTLTKHHKTAFREIMLNAFRDDPLFTYAFKGPERLEQQIAFLDFMFENSLVANTEILGFFKAEELQAVALLDLPEKASFQQNITLLSLVLKLSRRLPFKSLLKLNTYMRLTAKKKAQHYLVMIAVKEEAQGQGFSRHLLEYCIQKTNASIISEGLGLDTENPKNISLYEHFGFQLVKTEMLQELSIYCMFRPKDLKRAEP